MPILPPLTPLCVLELGGFPTHSNNSRIQAGCPPIQLNSDTIYVEITSDPTSEGLSFSFSDARCKFRCHLCFWLTGHRLDVFITSSLHSINFLWWLTGLRETFYLWKGCTRQSMRKRWGVSRPSPSVPLSPNVPVLTNMEALRILSFGFVWQFHYLGRID